MKLYDYQVPCLNKIKQIHVRHNFCLNIAEMGTGKSVLAAEYGREFKHVIVVSQPNVIKQNWKLMCAEHGFNYTLLTINKLRGMKNSPLKHKFLTREETPLSRDRVVFHVTSNLEKLCEEPTLIILDEIQMAKNSNISFAAIQALCSTGAKVLALSGTPIDDEIQIVNYLKLSGLITTTFSDLYNSIYGEVSDTPRNKLKKVYMEYFLPIYTTSMETESVDFAGFIKILPMSSKEKNTELDKLDFFVEEVQAHAHDQTKLIFGCFYLETINKLMKRLKRHPVACIQGSTPEQERERIIAEFQQPTSKVKILVANYDIISTGINLDDVYGDWPRKLYVAVNPKIMMTHQLRYRITRATTKSKSEMYIVATEDDNIHRTHKKSTIMSLSSCSVFPNEFTFI